MHICMDEVNLVIAAIRDLIYMTPLIRVKMGFQIMKKITTSNGTYYLLDEDNRRAMRVKGEGRNEMFLDGDWFYYISMGAWDKNDNQIISPPVVGKPVFFNLTGPREYDWRMTTTVRSIEEVDE